jgi:hypothetical protein
MFLIALLTFLLLLWSIGIVLNRLGQKELLD